MAINLLLLLIYTFEMEEVWGSVTKTSPWLMTGVVFRCVMQVLYKCWCHGTAWMDHLRNWYTSQIQSKLEVIKSDTRQREHADNEKYVSALKHHQLLTVYIKPPHWLTHELVSQLLQQHFPAICHFCCSEILTLLSLFTDPHISK